MGRFLMLPYAPTSGVAHLGACAAVGDELRSRGHEVVFGYGGSLPELIERQGFHYEPVLEVAPEREWHPAGRFRSAAELRRLVGSHLELIERVRPDAAVTSANIAPRLACELAGLPQAHLMHYLARSRYGRVPGLVWRARLRDARRPLRLAAVLRARFRRARGGRDAPQETLVGEARLELGLPDAGPDAIGQCRDSLVLLTTTPDLEPARGLPAHWSYVGPVTWSAPADGAPPERRERPLVYLTQGSTGSADVLERAVTELAGEPVDVVATTGGLLEPAALERLAPNVRAARFLPGRVCLEAADAAVIHGGHLTSLEALVTGTPVVVTPYRGDQFNHASRAERLGTGIGVWPSMAPPGAIRRAVRRLLRRSRYRRRAREVAANLAGGWDGRRNAADRIEELAA